MKKQTSQNTPLSQPFPQWEKGVTTNVFFPSTRGGGIKGGSCKAFTLVELIVVITILAILGTISFISLQGYSKDARDTKRINDVRSLLTKINVENTKGTPLSNLIIEDEPATGRILGVENTPFQTMGKIDFTNLNENPNDFKDPDNTKDYLFAYAIGQTGSGRYNFIEGMAITETQGIKISGNYYTTTAQDIPSLFVEGGEYYVEGGEVGNGGESIADKTTEEILADLPDTEYDDQLPSNACAGCKDILIGDGSGSGYIIRDRNEGATAVYNGETEPTTLTTIPAYRGHHYQWGRDIGFAIASGQPNAEQLQIDPATRNTNTNFIYWAESIYDWSTTREDHLWGFTPTGTSVGTITGNKQGPCPTGYHVPSSIEWDSLVKLWFENNNGTCNASVGSYCTWGTEATFTKFKTDLKIPLAPFRSPSSGRVYGQGEDVGSYWSSSPNGNKADVLYFYSNGVLPHGNESRGRGFSVRCFKN